MKILQRPCKCCVWTGHQKVFVKSSDVALGVWKSSSPETRDRLLLSKHIKQAHSFKKWHKGPGINMCLGETHGCLHLVKTCLLWFPTLYLPKLIFLSQNFDFISHSFHLFLTIWLHVSQFNFIYQFWIYIFQFDFIYPNSVFIYHNDFIQMISYNSVFILTFISQLHLLYWTLQWKQAFDFRILTLYLIVRLYINMIS